MSGPLQIETYSEIEVSAFIVSPRLGAAPPLSHPNRFWLKTIGVVLLVLSCGGILSRAVNAQASGQEPNVQTSSEIEAWAEKTNFPGSWTDRSRMHMEPSLRYERPKPREPEKLIQVATPPTVFCADAAENCMLSRCCKVTGSQCYQKDATWAGCREFCVPGIQDFPFSAGSWSCKMLSGVRMPLLPHRTGLSLFCWSVMQTHGHELELVQQQFSQRVSIFACNDWAVFSDISVDLGRGGKSVKTTPIGVVRSKMGGQGPLGTDSWVNTEVFFRAWDAIQRRKWHEGHDWTVKADPDAVFFPGRLRSRLARTAVGLQGAYVVNCKGVKHGFFGSLEVISRDAVRAYLDYFQTCLSTLPWHGWGEDLFAEQCMDMAGVDHISDFGLVSDGKCKKDPRVPDCSSNAAAFHPFKHGESYFECMGLAEGGW